MKKLALQYIGCQQFWWNQIFLPQNKFPMGGLKAATFPTLLSCRRNRCWPARGRMHRYQLSDYQLIAHTQVWPQALPFQQFYELFNSPSKVLFIFRSLYLCAIGLRPIFSFRWNLSPIGSCIPKQLDSSKGFHMGLGLPGHRQSSHSPWRPISRNLDRPSARNTLCRLQLVSRKGQISNMSCCRFTRRYLGNPCWFLFLHLLIYLNSAGIPTWFEGKASWFTDCLAHHPAELAKAKR